MTFYLSAHCSVSQYDSQNNSFRKRLESTQKFTFDFVSFLFFFFSLNNENFSRRLAWLQALFDNDKILLLGLSADTIFLDTRPEFP